MLRESRRCRLRIRSRPGDLPHPLCMVAFVLDGKLRHERPSDYGATISIRAAIRHRTRYFVCCLFGMGRIDVLPAIGMAVPKHIFDLHTCYLAATNILLPYDPDDKRNRPRKRLSDACKAYGVEGWERIDKDVISKDIGEAAVHISRQGGLPAICEERQSMRPSCCGHT